MVGRAAAKQERPIGGAEDFLELTCRLSGGVDAADEATHAGASEVVDGDVMLFKPFEHADVGFAEGTVSFEGDTDLRTRYGRRLGV